MADIIDHHQVLNISRHASKEEIKAAFRKMALKHHPDIGGCRDEFIKVRKSYDALTKQPIDDEKQSEKFAMHVKKATIWAVNNEGIEMFGECEYQNQGGRLKVIGNIKAGNLSYDGNIIIKGNPSSFKIPTVITGRNITIDGNINGATINGDQISFHDISGHSIDGDLTPDINGSYVSFNNTLSPVYICGNEISCNSLHEGTIMEANNITIKGHIGAKCIVGISESLKISSTDVPDDMKIFWNDQSVTMAELKGLKIDGEPILNGVITAEELDQLFHARSEMFRRMWFWQ